LWRRFAGFKNREDAYRLVRESSARGTAGWRARVEAYALSFYGNAHRACKDLDQARAAFAQARKLRSAFSAHDPRWLDESRLPDGAMPDPCLA
jgi:hypothetical protein